MYRKVLVPLDGSKLAECTLPHVEGLAKEGSIGEVVLLRIVETLLPFEYGGADGVGIVPNYDFEALWEEQVAHSQKYLASIEDRLSKEGIKVRTEALRDLKAAGAIIKYTDENGINLVIMSTHGYSGLKKLLLGSVALSVLHESHAPVLLIQPEACALI